MLSEHAIGCVADGAQLHIAHGACSHYREAATREPTKGPRGLTEREPLAGRPSPELAGSVPKTDRRTLHF